MGPESGEGFPYDEEEGADQRNDQHALSYMAVRMLVSAHLLLLSLEFLSEIELLVMQQRIALHEHGTPHDFFQFFEILILVRFEHLGDVGMHA